MIEITEKFKGDVIHALNQHRENFGGTDAAFAKQLGINASVYSRVKAGETEKVLSASQWLNLGRQFGISLSERKWNVARTDVFNTIEADITFCQAFSKGKICVDDTAIGKTYSAKHLARTLKNCFFLDASQCKTRQLFIRNLAKTLGLDSNGKYADVKALIKYCLLQLDKPMVIIDEAGDLDYTAFLELKELWNATENACGWYMMGADGLREKIDRGIRSKKVGYREIFSRYSERYTTVVPRDNQERLGFYKKLLDDVLRANKPAGMTDADLAKIINRCLSTDATGTIGGLRRAESLLILNQQ